MTHWQIIEQDLQWIAQILEERDDFFCNDNASFCFGSLIQELEVLPSPVNSSSDISGYAQLVAAMHQHTSNFFGIDPTTHQEQLILLQHIERVILLMVLIPYLRPELYNCFRKKDEDGDVFIEFGGLWQTTGNNPFFLPTGQTLVHVLAGQNLERRALVTQILSQDHYLIKEGVIKLRQIADHLPLLNQQLLLGDQYVELLVKQASYHPQYSEGFPATLLNTSKGWEDLILDEKTTTLVNQARKWVVHYGNIRKQCTSQGMKGYRLLMSGPSGTGKSFTAALLGKEAGKPIYRIDISNIVDKYVGETSKKLAKIFALAEKQDWILFFDEGDALFGKRSSGGGQSNERYANQEVSYLLYKLEEYEGMIFLATNKGTAIDDAFERRFDSLIEFRKPDEYTRQQLWHYFFDKPGILELAPEINQGNWRELANKGKVSGAWIEKFYQYCLMQASAKGSNHITTKEMRQYIQWYSWERGYFNTVHKDLFQRKH